MESFIRCTECNGEDFWNYGGFLRCQSCLCDSKPGYRRLYLGKVGSGGGLPNNTWGKWEKLRGKLEKFGDGVVPFVSQEYL